MSGESDLTILLASMEPVRQPGTFVFVSVPEVPAGCHPVATVQEAEGLTLVLTKQDADAHALGAGFEAAMISLTIHSALDAVGLTAAFAKALASEGISCNVIAGYFHDHLFVPVDRADEAMDALGRLAAGK